MQTNFRNGAALLLLAAAALATWYFGRRAPQNGAGVAPSGAYPLGYYLRDAELLGTDEDGKVVYRLRAALAQEQPNEGRLLLQNVHFDYQPAEKVPWSISAARGEAPTGGDTEDAYVDLEGNVVLTSASDAPGPVTRIETEQLRIEPVQHLATAKGPVHISVGGQTLDAVGLKAFLKEGRLELESRVHGLFLP
ncbi:MAG TPA: LPS export ABC transporter periplasmic protein LptC [Gammaproteobacteria bacterium]|nr:LPS export ABC transporter periplasmic protein LptC [Gammaproteobacteria bacterium]